MMHTLSTELNPVSQTMLMTLAARAAASVVAPDTDFHDPWGAFLLEKFPKDLKSYQKDFDFVRHIALRSKLIDRLATGFFLSNPGSVGVGLGCGLCTRGRRILGDSQSQSSFEWIDIDLPAVIDIRRKYLPPLPGEHLMACSVTDMSWFDTVFQSNNRSMILVMEGVSSYLSYDENKKFFNALGNRLEKSGAKVEMIFDYIHPSLVDSPYASNKAGGTSMPFCSGFCDADAVRNLHPSIQIISEHDVYSKISPRHALFAMEFFAASRGQKPCNIIHVRFGRHG